MTFEVELKFPLPKIGDVKERLRLVKAILIGKEVQEDNYFNGKYVDFAQTDEALRIRKIEGNPVAELTYKGPLINSESKTREEIIIGVNEPIKMAELLEKLGYSPSVTVRKVRENWKHEDYSIALDNVDKLGTFIELEMFTEEQELIPARVNELKAFAIQLGIDVNQQIRKGYLDLIIEKTPRSRD